jgi:flagellar hook-associated protein 1
MGFSSLQIGVSGLLAHRRATEVAGDNLANVNTEGHSRRRVELRAAGGVSQGLWAGYRASGEGVEVADITRIRDEFLERRALGEHASMKDLERVDQTLRRIELVFPEPSDTAMGATLQKFWAGFEDLANKADSPGVRSQAMERGDALVQSINEAAGQLTELQGANRRNIGAIVAEVNGTVETIADLNSKIRAATNSGNDPHQLMDQRDLAILNLSKQVGVTVRTGEAGMVDVSIGGTPIVRGDRFDRLVVDETTTPPAGSASERTGLTFTTVRWEKDGQQVQGLGGEVGGLLTTVNETLPSYLDDLNEMARSLATQVNAVHVTGFDLNGNPGVAMFGYQGTAPAPLAPPQGWAANLRLAVTDGAQLAASSTAGSRFDGAIATQLAAIGDGPNAPDVAYNAIVATLGVEARTVREALDAQTNVVEAIDIDRQSVSGVNLDEEMTSLLASQRAYEASARFINVVDEMLDTLINRTAP